MEKNNEKAIIYENLMRENDLLDRKISQLKATNAGINLSEEIEKQIYQLLLKKIEINNQVMNLYNS